MRIALGLLAFSLIGAGGQSETGSPSQVLTFQVRVVETEGVNWRASVYPDMRAVTRQGGATVWTASGDVLRRLEKTLRDGVSKVVVAPKVTVRAGQPAHVSTRSDLSFVADFDRLADGPVNHASYVAYVAKVEKARAGFAATVQGRKLDQGVLAQIVLDDTRITSVHPVVLTEVSEPSKQRTGAKAWKGEAKIEVPELSRCEVAGEWLIPNDGALVMSLGVFTVADKQGKAVVRERLAIVEAESRALPASTVTALRRAMLDRPAAVELARFAGGTSVPAPMSPVDLALPMPFKLETAVPLPSPFVPTRSLPQALNAEGQPVALPPLPAENAPPTAFPGSSDPCATPQARGVKPGVETKAITPPVEDPASTRASYSVEPPVCTLGDSCCSDRPELDRSAALEPMFLNRSLAQELSPEGIDFDIELQDEEPFRKRFNIRLPVLGDVTVEVRSAPLSPAKRSRRWQAAEPKKSSR